MTFATQWAEEDQAACCGPVYRGTFDRCPRCGQKSERVQKAELRAVFARGQQPIRGKLHGEIFYLWRQQKFLTKGAALDARVEAEWKKRQRLRDALAFEDKVRAVDLAPAPFAVGDVVWTELGTEMITEADVTDSMLVRADRNGCWRPSDLRHATITETLDEMVRRGWAQLACECQIKRPPCHKGGYLLFGELLVPERHMHVRTWIRQTIRSCTTPEALPWLQYIQRRAEAGEP